MKHHRPKLRHFREQPFPPEEWKYARYRRIYSRRRLPPFQHGGGFIFAFFLVIFGVIAFFLVTGLGSIIYVVQQALAEHFNQNVFISSLLIAFIFIILAVVLGKYARSSITNPLADVFRIVESVMEGDYTVRLPENRRGSFRPLAMALNQMVDELERTDKLRRNLTADVAHELNTPLHIIQGYLEGIQDGVYQADEETLGIMLEETQLLGRLVADLRTLSLAEAGELPLEMEQVNVGDLVGDVVTSFSGQAETADISLTSESERGLQVTGDSGRLDQVLSNLVVNALRHTDQGGQVRIKGWKDGEDVLISVKDNGQGIPAEELPLIFERFWRGDRSRQHVDGAGHGLGLAIASQLVKAHGGEISVQSEVGVGTEFTVVLPVGE